MVNKWDIYYCALDPARGSEQRGKRPVLVVSNDVVNHLLPVLTVLPLSSFKQGGKIYPSEVLLPSSITGLPKNSIAMVQQVRTIPNSRLSEFAGRLEDDDAREAIREAIRTYFEV
ncbi:MAG: type II toxin-antitoxin system PemK/MazF family toxin [Synergistaceae bacterium]|jgi:mRNA interferase MazF|nr:type II toxin-antitoxin system PemK/MazF family toxin [Synergistaceae bacterium]